MDKNIVGFDELEYNSILRQAVAVIDESRVAVARSVTTISNTTYWRIGKILKEKKLESKHGGQVVRRLSADLKERYPQMGMSPRNLWYMKTFYERYAECDEKVQRSVALLPWSHNEKGNFVLYLFSNYSRIQLINPSIIV